MGDTSLYKYKPEIKEQSKNGGITAYTPYPPPPNSDCKNPLEKWSPASIFWNQDGILLIDYLSNGQIINAGYYSSLLVKLKDILKQKAAGRSRRRSCSCTTMPLLTGHFQRRRNWPTTDNSVLITHFILRIWPPRTTDYSMDWKTIEKSPFFVRRETHCCRWDLVGRTIFFVWHTEIRATE